MTTGKTIALTRRTFVDKVMSLLLNMLSRLVITSVKHQTKSEEGVDYNLTLPLCVCIYIYSVCVLHFLLLVGKIMVRQYLFMNILSISERDGNTRPPDLPLEKPVCRSGSNRKRSVSRLYIVTLLI